MGILGMKEHKLEKGQRDGGEKLGDVNQTKLSIMKMP